MRTAAVRRHVVALVGVTLIVGLSITTGVALGAKSERPASDVEAYAVDLRAAAKLAAQAKSSTGWLAGHNARRCAQVEPGAAKLAAAADAAKAVFERYQKAKSRYGLQEEIRLITAVALDLRESVGSLRKASGETFTPSSADEQGALKEVGVFRRLLALELESRLQVAGLADVLTSRSFREVKDKVVSELHWRLRARAEQELKRLTGLGIRLDVPLKTQIKDFLRAELSRFLTKLVVSAGPARILISIVGGKLFDPGRLVDLVGAKLKAALRQKGKLDARTATTLAGFERLRRSLNALPPNAPIDQVRQAVRSAQQVLGATKFLVGDLTRAKRNDLLLDLRDASADLERTLSLSKRRFLLDSALLGEDFGVGVAAMKQIRSEAERVSKKLGCKTPPPASGGGSTSPPGAGGPPTAAVCKPATIRIEYFSDLGPKLGEYNAVFGKLVQTYPGNRLFYKCLWTVEGDTTRESFVVFLELVPAGTPGALPSGDCGRSRPDNPPFYYSRKRYLTVSGGNRGTFQRALGGNEKILKGVLAAAEAAGVGKACAKAS